MNDSSLRQRLLAHVLAPGYRPVKPRVIAEKMDLDDAQTHELKRLVKRLVKRGELAYGPRHMVLPPFSTVAGQGAESTAQPAPAKKGELIGLFRRAAAGYGFVTPDNLVPSKSTEPVADVFIPEFKSGDAADGDRVRIRMSRTKDRFGRTSGMVVEVLERRTHRFVGSYRSVAGEGFVRVDGAIFAEEIQVGDASAKNCQPGDKVVIDMVHFPSVRRAGEAVIVEVLGPRGKPGVDTISIIHQFGLPGEFPQSVIADAYHRAEHFDESDFSGRTDFTSDTVITIDPREARDFDDAISLRQSADGHWTLGVHIADVSHFVQPDTALDVEARARGTSVYLPDRVIPMLPETISNNLASLQPGRNRYSISAIIEFDEHGRRTGTELHRGVICSAHRFNYEEVDDYLNDDRPWKAKLDADVFRLLRDMHTLAMQLRKRRMTRGAIELVIPDVKILLDKDGRVAGAQVEEYTESHQMIEEFMLAANEAVAYHLIVDHSLHILRRVHESPSPLKLKQLAEFVSALGLNADGLESRHEIKRLIEQAAGLPESGAVNVAVLRSMQKAVYSPRDIGHYALNSDYYCHFTSPIRRYPDLEIHRMVGALLDGRRPPDDFVHLTRLGEHCSQLEQRAERAERDLIRLKLLNYLFDKVGIEFEAMVTGVEAIGLFALCEPLPVDGLIPVNALPRDRYRFDRASRSLTGHRAGNEFRIGDRLRVRVALVDPDQRELELEMVERLPHAAPAGSGRKKPKKPKKKSAESKQARRGSKPGSKSRGKKKKNARQSKRPRRR